MEKTLPSDYQRIADGLKAIVDVLEREGIPYILEGGTLLGAIREGRFLPWDKDVGIAVPSESFYEKMDLILSRLGELGFTPGYRDDAFGNCKVNITRDETRYEILGWFARGSWRRQARYRMPRRFLEERRIIRFYNYDFYVPQEDGKYLRHFYGNWKVPKKSGRFFTFYCFDQKVFWTRQVKKLFPILFKNK